MKKHRFQLYLLGLLVLFGAYVLMEHNRPKPVDRTPTFINHDKIPYGTYALFKLLPDLFGQSPQMVRKPIFYQIYPDADPGSPQLDSTLALPRRINYCFINRYFQLSTLDCDALLRFVAHGNDVFIAAEYFDPALSDTLHFDVARYPRAQTLRRRSGVALTTDSVALHFVSNGPASRRTFHYPASFASTHFTTGNSSVSSVLATDGQNSPVLLRIAHGRGNFYLCSVPIAFTNQYVLRPRTSDFAFASLSYLPAPRTVWWDEFQKQGSGDDQSLLRVVLRYPALRTAFYASLLGIVLFILFEAKRRQRIIPILKPLPNTTLLFTRTVASLYRQGSNHQLIAEKKIGLFLEYIRTRFQENTVDIADEHFRERLAQKSGVARHRVDELIRLINFARTAPRVSDQDLLILSRAISTFRQAAR